MYEINALQKKSNGDSQANDVPMHILKGNEYIRDSNNQFIRY
jgi:hypothetical protein